MKELLVIAFVIGIGGSLHCIGMCGPIGLAVATNTKSRAVLLHGIIYNFGRAITYGLFGMLIGIVGFGFKMVGIQKFVSIAIGIFLIISVLFPFVVNSKWFPNLRTPKVLQELRMRLTEYIKDQRMLNRLTLGVLNGLLPCGLVYLALMNSLLASGPLEGFLFMFFFGLGTFPIMLIFPVMAKLTDLRKLRLSRLIPVFMTFLGFFLIYRGLSFDHPLMNKTADIITNCLP